MSADLWVWGIFFGFISLVLALDLFAFHRDARVVSMREAAIWSAVWSGLGLAFGGLLWFWHGPTAAGEYPAGYLIEKSRAVTTSSSPPCSSATSLCRPPCSVACCSGVWSGPSSCAAFIVAGAALFERFHWVIYVFGGQVVVTGFRMALQREDKVLPERNPLLRLARRIVPVTKEYRGQHFVLRESGRLVATPLSVTLRRQPRRSVPEGERGMSRGSVLVLSSPLSPLDRGQVRAPRLGLRATVVAECGSGRANIRRGPREVRIHRPERTPDVPERQAGIVNGTGAWRGEVDVAVHDGIKRRAVGLI